MQQHLLNVPICGRLAKLDLPGLIICRHKHSAPQFASQRRLSMIVRILSMLVVHHGHVRVFFLSPKPTEHPVTDYGHFETVIRVRAWLENAFANCNLALMNMLNDNSSPSNRQTKGAKFSEQHLRKETFLL